MSTAVSTGEHGAPGALASWWRGRYGARLLFEIFICGALLMIYRTIRLVNKTDLSAAFANAREIVRFEEWLGLPFEDNLQRFLLYTNRQFLTEHPTAAEDFMRAAMRGLADAIADPQAAATIAVEVINGNGNPFFFSPDGEAFRWTTDAQLITDTTPIDTFVGVPDPAALATEIAAYDAVGIYAETGVPPVEGRFDPDLLAGLYASDGSVIWPAEA